MLREDRNQIIIGRSVDIPAASASGDRVHFTTASLPDTFSHENPDRARRSPVETFNRQIDTLQQRYGPGLQPEKAIQVAANNMAAAGWTYQDIKATVRLHQSPILQKLDVDDYAGQVAGRACAAVEQGIRSSRPRSSDIER